MEKPLTREVLAQKVTNVQQELDIVARTQQWHEILNDIHQQAVFLPLWGTRIPYVINRRLDNFEPSQDAFTYPLKNVAIISGSSTVTVSPGSGGALFASVGPMNPHQYFPNQIFASGWIYEGLVSYGSDGVIAPALATDWDVVPYNQGQRATFKLREGVKFHDGSDWNCSVAKLNFDHILSDTVRQRHSWYGTPNKLTNWSCNSDGDFILETSEPYYPLLQELTYVRPLVFASAAAFSEGLDSHPDEHNSCNPGDFGSKWDYLEQNITCMGLKAPIGTGPFKFVNRTYLPGSNEEIDEMVIFASYTDYWGKVPEIEYLKIKYYEKTDDVYKALEEGELDMVLGTGPLTSIQVRDIQFHNSTNFDVIRGEVLQNAILVMNTNREPTNDINVRKAIIHGINKAEFIDKEFAGLEQPVNQLLPLSAPYCDVDLNPKWDYDLEKALMLNCGGGNDTNSSISVGAIVTIVIALFVVLGLGGFVIHMIDREKKGKPLFSPEQVDKGEEA
jgi:ABC-type transport system substrate-binding protein